MTLNLPASYKTGTATIKGAQSATVTITIASPAVVSWTAHGLSAGDTFVPTTTGALPTGLTAGTTYYILAAGLTTNAFEVSATPGGAAINTSGSQSGTHTGASTSFTVLGVGTAWSATVQVGDTFVGTDGREVEIASVTDDTHVVLDHAWPGASQAAAYYRIVYAPDGNRQLVKTRQAVEALKIPQTGMPMVFDGTGTTDIYPGQGKVRFNDPTTPTIAYIAKTDIFGNSIDARLLTFDDSVNAVARSVLSFRPTDGANAFIDFDVTGALTDGTTYYKVPVTMRAGTVPANLASLAMAGVPSGADGAVASVNGQTGAVLLKASEQIENLGLAFSVGSSALTCAAKQADGATNASASAPIFVGMRNATLTSGAFAQRSITGALSLIVPSTATLGHTSAVAGNLYWYLIDNAGTLELAVSATDFGRAGIASTTTIAGGSNTAATMYSTTGRSNVPFRKIASTIDTQTVAGTWAAIPSTVQLSPTADDTKLAKANNLSDLAGKAASQINLGVREVLTGARTYYVRTDGNDSNTGLVDSAGGGFLTLQKAWNTACNLDINGQTVTIQIDDGTYTGNLDTSLSPFGGVVTIQGNAGTPANVLISCTSKDCFAFRAPLANPVVIKNMKLQTTTSGNSIGLYAGGLVQFSGINFGATAAGNVQIAASAPGAHIQAIGAYTISGGCTAHLTAADGAQAQTESITVTLSGTPAFSGAYALAQRLGNILARALTFSGSATGPRYSGTMGSVIETGGGGASYFPGNSGGSVATGAQYE